MQALIDQQGGGFKLQPWDWQFYAEQVRKSEYDLDESQVRPYFDLGFNHLVFHAPGDGQAHFLELYGSQILPRIRKQWS